MESPRRIASLTVIMAPLWILTAVVILVATTVGAQEAKWRELSKEGETLIRADKGDAALAKLKESAELAEQALGPDHPDVAAPLSLMAHLLEVRVQVDEAEPLFQRAFAILEKALGAEHPTTVWAMYELAEILARQRKYALAEPLFERTLANWEKTSKAEGHVRVAVGTRISPRPPHRSRRALLTHRAPPSGSGVEAVTGHWM